MPEDLAGSIAAKGVPEGPAQSTGSVERQDLQTGQVRDLAVHLFNCTHSWHHLGEDRRRLLEEAARLHYLQPQPGNKKSIRAVRESVQARTVGSYSDQEFSPEEQSALAALIVFQHPEVREKTLSAARLSPAWERDFWVLAALLRIAIALDQSGSQPTRIQRVTPVYDELWIVVGGPEAVAGVRAAQPGAELWSRTGLPALKVLETGQAEAEALKYPPLPEPMQRAGIEPGDSMAEAGRKVMRFHFAEMLRHDAGTRLGEDIEALHDMRVATRRMRAAFEVFEDAFEPKALKPLLKGLRATGRALGRVRDLDVFMEKAQHYLEGLPESGRDGLAPLLEAWGSEREKARAEMLAHLDRPDYQSFLREFNIFVSTPGAGARQLPQDLPVPFRVREIAPTLIYTRLASVRAFDSVLENAAIETLHALRIEFKKLRYTVEFFREVLGEETKAVISDLKKLQDHLGDLNDAQVAAQILGAFLEQWDAQQAERPLAERQNPAAIVTYLAARHAERHRLMATFGDAWASFNRPEFKRNLALAVSAL